MLTGRVLITGGTGSLGTAILKRAEVEGWDAEFTILARGEKRMTAVTKRFPKVRGELGDVKDLQYLKSVFPGHDTIIHAAAIKQVPTAQSNPIEATKINVEGSANVAIAAVAAGVGRVVGISTDKACGPTYYGITKRLMEGYFIQANTWSDKTDFVLCRYGNVLRSAASVVPFFEKVMKTKAPFPITDFRMTRFWLSMSQAIDLILFTYKTADAGQIVIPKAPAMSMLNLAQVLDPRRACVEIGIRPGERMHEALVVREESLHTWELDNHFIINPASQYEVVSDNMGYPFEYTSDTARQLTAAEMVRLLDESPGGVL